MDRQLQKHLQEKPVLVRAGSVVLEGILYVPQGATGIVVFVKGSGSYRDRLHDRFIAQILHNGKLATLLIDLLTPEEQHSDRVPGRVGFDIDRLVARLMGVTHWLSDCPATQHLKIGYLGDSTGSPVALVTATFCQDAVRAIACYSGRLDFAGSALFQVTVPILLVVGGHDILSVGINRRAINYLRTKKRLVILPDVTHLCETPGSLEEVARLAMLWFEHYLAPVERQEPNVQNKRKENAIAQSWHLES
ncbi:MAG: dienelactone hydrolase family protein [Coleofasciculaceae cyanobacterium]